MIWIVYASRAVADQTADDLGSLLARARSNNAARGVTGMLLYRTGRFLQVLEGPQHAVRERMAVIQDDERHRDVRILLDEPIARRQFPQWTMGFPTLAPGVKAMPGFRGSVVDLDLKRDEFTVGSWALRELVRDFMKSERN